MCSSNADGSENAENLSWNVWFFFAAQLLHGAGAAPLFTLGVTYIDENVSKKMSSVYLGKCFAEEKKTSKQTNVYKNMMRKIRSLQNIVIVLHELIYACA